MLVPLMAPGFVALAAVAPPITGGLESRWRETPDIVSAGEATAGGRGGKALLTNPF